MSCGCCADLNLFLPVGTSPIWTISIVDPDSASTPVNITGATFAFYVKATGATTDEDAEFVLTSGDSEIVITTAASGLAQIHNQAEKSALLAAGTVYYCSLRATFSSGETRTVRAGSLTAEYA